MYRILLIVTAIIAYGSLYPFDFHSALLAASPPWVLIHSWPAVINRFVIRDIAINLLIYMPLGLFGFLAFRQNLGSALAALTAVLIGFVLSSSIEMIQLFDDARDCSASDVVCDVTGTVTGVALGTFYQRRLKQSISRTQTRELPSSERSRVARLRVACLPGISLISVIEPDPAGREAARPLCESVRFHA